MQKQQDGTVGKAHCNVGPQGELAGIVDRLLAVSCTHTAAHHRDHGKAEGLAGNDAHAVQIVCHRVGRDLHRTEGGDHAHHQNASGLEQAVLKGGRDANTQDAPGHADPCVQTGGLRHREGVALLVASAQDEERCHHAGHHAGPCNAVHAHFQAEDAHCIAHDIDNVHQ